MTKFNVGDKVRVIKLEGDILRRTHRDDQYGFYKNSSGKTGVIYRSFEFYKNTHYCINWDDGMIECGPESELRFIDEPIESSGPSECPIRQAFIDAAKAYVLHLVETGGDYGDILECLDYEGVTFDVVSKPFVTFHD